ncbi:hypothetical protein EKK58_00260 [Candidatus Dependentiae bacterium]|nr:MAG: hypothetical protein EKK58_00260 [Candidatus Dependentiae bacterium]
MSHLLAQALNSTVDDILTAIAHGRRSVVDTKGKLAELHLHRLLLTFPFAEVNWVEKHGEPDFRVRLVYGELSFKDYKIECKNIRSLQVANPDKFQVELQKTRHSKTGKTERGYRNDHFHILAVCLFNRTGGWTFLFHAANTLPTDPKQPCYLQKMIAVPAPDSELGSWRRTPLEAIEDYEHARLQGIPADQRATDSGRCEEAAGGNEHEGVRADVQPDHRPGGGRNDQRTPAEHPG